jgi:hypothetical protein
VKGSLVLVEYPRVLAALDMPIIREGKQAWVDGFALGNWLVELEIDLAVVELVHTWAGNEDGAQSAAQHAKASRIAMLTRLAGGVETMLSSLSIPMRHATAAAWKKRANLPGKAGRSEAEYAAIACALARAQLSWPDELALSKTDHCGRAEAGLIAVHGMAAERAPPRPKRRSKAVDKAAAENVPPTGLAGMNLLERFVATHDSLNAASLEDAMVAIRIEQPRESASTLLERFVAEHGGESAFLPVSPKAVALKVGKARLRSLGLGGSARVVRGRGPVGEKKRPAG